MQFIRVILGVALLGIALFSPQSSSSAQPPAPSSVHVTAQADGVRLEWRNNGQHAIVSDDWPLIEQGAEHIPARLIALNIHTAALVTPQFTTLESIPQPGTRESDKALPAAPVWVLRDSRMRGQRIVVVGVSPLFMQNGVVHAVTRLAATIPGGSPLTENATHLLSSSGPFLSNATPPPNRSASVPALKIKVQHPGIQRITGAQLAAAGLSLATLDPTRIHIHHEGRNVLLEERSTGDGRLDATDELRFYAASVGDRWNASDTYWLTVETTPGSRMTRRTTTPTNATLRSSAYERGTWRNNTIYESSLPGDDGDHWFARDLRTGSGQPAARFTVPLTSTLALAPGPVTLTVRGSARTAGQHQLSAQIGGSSQTVTWSGAANWTQTFTLMESGQQAEVTLSPSAVSDALLIDSVSWSRPVRLDAAGSGAVITGVPGTWHYQLTHAPVDAALYDVTDSRAPTILAIPGGTSLDWEDGPAAHTYVLSGSGTLFTPSVTASTPVDLSLPLNGNVIYIAPATFHPALVPLIAHRRTQGERVRVVDVQAIYDAWSYGQVSPVAIRDFLRYQATISNPAPGAVTLVGDGTSDPLNYTRRNNQTFVPPFLAMVDPWLGETACETCYAQLDGTDPLSDLLPDLALGRFPVKSVVELTAMVNKIIGYETDASGISWRSRNVYIADNADSAGDFAAQADRSVAEQPANIMTQRIYYDPTPGAVGVPWREPNATRAYQRTLAALNEGAGIVNYVGHSHYWQWAFTDPNANPSWLLGMYDVDTLTNGSRLPIILEMTCLTSAFQQPALSGTTIDERWVLAPNGGAIATWGSTGLGLAHGHDALQRGFYRALWSAPPMSASLGVLTTAGYLELFTNSGCCQDALHTFALLGDPRTPARVLVPQRTYLPALHK